MMGRARPTPNRRGACDSEERGASFGADDIHAD
jgi:hypothetical protein